MAYEKPFDPLILRTIALLALVACALSGFLAWHTWQAGPVPGCDGNSYFGCDEVLGTPWSRWLGIPVGALAVLVYAAIVGATIVLMRGEGRYAQLAHAVLIPACTMAGCAAAWFIGIQVWQLKKICLYCMAVHGCGLLIAAVMATQLYLSRQTLTLAHDLQHSLGLADAPAPVGPRVPAGALMLLGMLGFALFVAGQVLFPARTYQVTRLGHAEVTVDDAQPLSESAGKFATQDGATITGPVAAPREDSLSAEETRTTQKPVLPAGSKAPRVSLGPDEPPRDRAELMLYGPPAAKFVVVEFQDYTCQTCRESYPRIEAALQRYGDRLAIAVFPVALERQCNPEITFDDARHRNACKLARLAMAVWRIDPAKFPAMHHWLLTSETFQRYSDAWNFASKLVNPDALLAAVDDPQIQNSLTENYRLMTSFGERLPLLLIGDAVVQGKVETDAELFELLERELGIALQPREKPATLSDNSVLRGRPKQVEYP